MALVLKDRVLETCTSPGTGTVTLLGAVTGYQSFSTVGNGNTCYYALCDQSGANWEVGIGTYSTAGTLARTTVLSSSNGGNLTNFSTGSQNVFLTYPSERSVNLSSAALTSGRVAYATTDGLLTDSANLLYSGTDLTVYGLTVGRGAGAVSTNTAVGASALAVNQAGGTNNTAIGNAALDANTTGDANTAVGDNALGANTTASNNTAVGYQSLYTNTTGTPNTAVGSRALYLNTTGYWNIAIGGDALYANTTGNGNLAIGPSALGSNTTGISNTAIGGLDNSGGSATMQNNTTGKYNVALGAAALKSNTTADGNTAVGYQS